MKAKKLMIIGIVAIVMRIGVENGFTATVNNPMTENLNGGGYSIFNVADLKARSINNVTYADQQAGVDAWEKIANALNALPPTGGICDARGLTGQQTFSGVNPLFVGNDTTPVLLVLGVTTITTSVPIFIGKASGVVGVPAAMADGTSTSATKFQAANNSNLAYVVAMTGDLSFLHDITIDGNSANNPTGGVGVLILAGRADIFRVSSWRNKSHGFHIQSTGTNNQALGSKIRFSTAFANGGDGLRVTNTSDTFILNTEFELNGGWNLVLDSSNSTRILQSDFGGGNLGGIKIVGQSGSANLQGTGTIIVGNSFGIENGPDIFIDGWDSVAGTRAAAAHQIVANHFFGLSAFATANTHDAVRIQDSTLNMVANNYFNSVAQATYRYGVSIQNVNASANRDTVIGNVFSGTFGTGYFNGSTQTHFSGNDEGGSAYARLFNVYFPNNHTLNWKDSSGTVWPILNLQSNDALVLSNSIPGKDTFIGAGGVNTVLQIRATGTDLNVGVGANGSGFKHARVSTGSIGGSGTASVTVNWGTAFPDTNYTVTASVVEATSSISTLRVHHIQSITAGSVVVVIRNDGSTARTGTLHVIAVHN